MEKVENFIISRGVAPQPLCARGASVCVKSPSALWPGIAAKRVEQNVLGVGIITGGVAIVGAKRFVEGFLRLNVKLTTEGKEANALLSHTEAFPIQPTQI